MRLLCSIIGVTIRHMDSLSHYHAVRDWITPKRIRHDLPGLGLMTADQAFEKSLGSSSIPTRLQEYIDDGACMYSSSDSTNLRRLNLSVPVEA